MKLLYNRYIPQADGSFLKTKLPDQKGDMRYEIPREEISPIAFSNQEASSGVSGRIPMKPGDFFRNLLPSDLDTEDLIVILLLLLLSQEGAENRDRALLTLGAYLFL